MGESGYKTRVQVPQVRDLETAIRLFYEKNELAPKDVKEIFGCSAPMAAKLIRRGQEEMELSGAPYWNLRNVNSECAFRSWGLDIGRMERALARLRKLGLAGSREELRSEK